MRRARAVLIVALVATVLPACTTGPRLVRIEMRYSKFLPRTLKVARGETVHFRLVNADPITHEFILGSEAVQQLHEKGRGSAHDGKLGQATLAPGETQEITYTFAKAGSLIFGCHRPGHYAYGMRGTVTVA